MKLDKGADHAGAESALLARWNVVGHMGGWTTVFAISRGIRSRFRLELTAGCEDSSGSGSGSGNGTLVVSIDDSRTKKPARENAKAGIGFGAKKNIYYYYY